MAVYIDEDFNELSLGFGQTPSGWSVPSGMEVRAFSDGGQYSPYLPAPPDHYYYGTSVLYPPSLVTFPYQITVWTGMRPDLDNKSFGSIVLNLLGNNGQPIGCLNVQGEPNNSISVYSGSQLFANSGQHNQSNFSYFYNIWYYIQFNATLMANLSTGTVDITFNVFFNGQLVVQTLAGVTPVNTGIFLTDIIPPPPFIGFYSVIFENGRGPNSWSRIVVEDLVAPDTYPVIRTPFIRANQLVVETAAQPKDANVLAFQMPIEVSKLPTTANVRISQYVIELITQTPKVGAGWIVEEA